MLVLNSNIINKPILSLQTGTTLANIVKPVIDPMELKIFAFSLSDRFDKNAKNYLMTKDIREFDSIGAIVDSSDEFVTEEDVIFLQKLLKININLTGMQVIDENKRKVGKVADYAIDSKDFFILQLHLNHGFMKSLSSSGQIIGRNQVIEINDKNIIVKSTEDKQFNKASTKTHAFINPFATSSSASESSEY